MRFVVQRKSRLPAKTGFDNTWILLATTWNDFSFLTLYELYLETEGKITRYGYVKILKNGQARSEIAPLEDDFSDGRLPEGYGSLGADLEYYTRLIGLGRHAALDVLDRLGDIALFSSRRQMLGEQDGVRKSLHRNLSQPNAFYADAAGIINAGGAVPEENRFRFKFTPAGAAQSIEFGFEPTGPEYSDLDELHRIVVIVGRNGVGKTRLLSSLARVAYAPPNERDLVATDGHLAGDAAFPSIVAISYSAFDKFDLPKLDGDDLDEVIKQLQDGTGRYAYCGMRDVASYMRSDGKTTRILNSDELDDIFVNRLEQIKNDDRKTLFAHVLAPVFAEQSFNLALDDEDDAALQSATREERELLLLDQFLGDDPKAAMKQLSSGHKIALHLLANMTACLKRRGLALIDEPETHLHPPLLAALMVGIRRVLVGLRAYAVVTSHSPVVAQETLSKYVLLIESGLRTRPAGIETFGENTGTLTRELFGLHTDATDYRRVLDQLSKKFGSIKEIEHHLGTRLSAPAVAHLMATFSGSK